MPTRRPPIARYAHDTTPTADLTWMAQGACTTTPTPDAWHPTTAEATDPHSQTALTLCATCPVRQTCRDYALARPWLTGIWGGLTQDQRTNARRHRRTAA